MTRIEISGLAKRFGATPIVDGLDLTVEEGEFLTLLGPSGCGKTTTLRCIAGLEHPDRGSIRIGDTVVADIAAGRYLPPERRRLGMMFQNYALWPHMSVGGNVAYPLERRKVAKAEIVTRVRDALRLVDLGGFEDRPISALSGGQQQRVALARTIVGEPKVLLFDEPLSNLDATLRESMRAELRSLHDRLGTTCIYVTHDQIEAMTLSDRVIVMNSGRIEQLGAPADIYERPATAFVARFLGVENLLTGEAVTTPTGAAVRVNGIDELLPIPDSAPQGEVVVGFRADAATIVPAGEPARNSLPATIVQRLYLGGGYEYSVESAAGRLTVRTTTAVGTSVYTPDTAIRVVLDPDRLLVLPAAAPEAKRSRESIAVGA